MFAYLKGTVQDQSNKALTLNVNGVGYEVFTANELIAETVLGQTLELFIYTNVCEDNISLFGFKNKAALAFFKLLISVNGIGPKSALEIMNTSLSLLKQAIAHKDADFLTKIPGIGKKTAERIILELQNKVEFLPEDAHYSPVNHDLVETIVRLGYQKHEVIKLISQKPAEIESEEEIVKFCLRNL